MNLNSDRTRLISFLAISLIWSLIWVTKRELVFEFIDKIPSLQFYFLGIIPVMGLFIGSLICRHRQLKNEMSVTGKNTFKSWLIISVPIAILTIVGVPNNIEIQTNLFGLVIGSFTMLYAFLEEFGWRGYLQPELSEKLSKWIVYVVIGLVWYLWHWYFLREGNNLNLMMIPILIAASIGIGEVARVTKSILICGALHGLVNILLIYGVIAQSITSQEKLFILVGSLVIWIPIVKKIEKENAVPQNV